MMCIAKTVNCFADGAQPEKKLVVLCTVNFDSRRVFAGLLLTLDALQSQIGLVVFSVNHPDLVRRYHVRIYASCTTNQHIRRRTKISASTAFARPTRRSILSLRRSKKPRSHTYIARNSLLCVNKTQKEPPIIVIIHSSCPDKAAWPIANRVRGVSSTT
jgi:hypothetical protein